MIKVQWTKGNDTLATLEGMATVKGAKFESPLCVAPKFEWGRVDAGQSGYDAYQSDYAYPLVSNVKAVVWLQALLWQCGQWRIKDSPHKQASFGYIPGCMEALSSRS